MAVLADSRRPAALMKALDGKEQRLGIGIDTGLLGAGGRCAGRRLALVRDRLRYVNLRDRAALGLAAATCASAKAPAIWALFLGTGAPAIRPAAMTLDTSGIV